MAVEKVVAVLVVSKLQRQMRGDWSLAGATDERGEAVLADKTVDRCFVSDAIVFGNVHKNATKYFSLPSNRRLKAILRTISFANERDEIGVHRLVSGVSHRLGDLAAMIGAVHRHVSKNVHHQRAKLNAFAVAVGDDVA